MEIPQPGQFYLATPAIEAFANTIRQWFIATIPGGVIYGESRAGKSSAIEYVKRARTDVFGYDIPVFNVQWKKGRLLEGAFYERMLEACKHALPTKRTKPSELEKRLIEFLASSVTTSGAPCLVWFVDDAHYLTVDDYAWLINVQNGLMEKKVQMYTFLVGEPRLSATRETFIVSGDNQIIGRFMWSQFRFPLLQSAKDLAVVLSGYDNYCPSASKVSITESCVPKAWAAGWRLADQAKVIWERYVTARRAASRDRPSEMRMQACTILVAQLLRLLNKRDASDLVLEPTLLDKVLELAV